MEKEKEKAPEVQFIPARDKRQVRLDQISKQVISILEQHGAPKIKATAIAADLLSALEGWLHLPAVAKGCTVMTEGASHAASEKFAKSKVTPNNV